jgi:hypothetical protein
MQSQIESKLVDKRCLLEKQQKKELIKQNVVLI